MCFHNYVAIVEIYRKTKAEDRCRNNKQVYEFDAPINENIFYISNLCSTENKQG